jgi:EAL and modified HD-GYP domain-containing signal transduction protein
MEKVLEQIPLAEDVKQALLGVEGPLKDILDYAVAYETGNWGHFEDAKERIVLEESTLPELHLEAVRMAEDVLMIGTSTDAVS